ncbi:hypothetical protein [Providencia heimbachae]|uniref:hypothetical protein n=1 Tax=Providencia TaxID=586 RepID=UPI000AEF9010|nr:hypothetical protein [Providencia heimbachae]NIH23362.1 hypothetical protein [Providencia heimbachae]
MEMNKEIFLKWSKNILAALLMIVGLGSVAIVSLYIGEYGFVFNADNLAKILS